MHLIRCAFARHGLRRLESEDAYEDRESSKQALLGLAEKGVAPVEQRVQCLVSGKRGSSPWPVETDAALQKLRRPRDAVRGDSGTPANSIASGTPSSLSQIPADDRHVCVGQLEPAAACRGPLQKQLHRRKLQRVGSAYARLVSHAGSRAATASTRARPSTRIASRLRCQDVNSGAS